APAAAGAPPPAPELGPLPPVPPAAPPAPAAEPPPVPGFAALPPLLQPTPAHAQKRKTARITGVADLEVPRILPARLDVACCIPHMLPGRVATQAAISSFERAAATGGTRSGPVGRRADAPPPRWRRPRPPGAARTGSARARRHLPVDRDGPWRSSMPAGWRPL